MSGQSDKLTRAQFNALDDYSQPWVIWASPHNLGIPSQVVGRLLKSGFVEPHPSINAAWDKNTRFRITTAGRAALSNSERTDG